MTAVLSGRERMIGLFKLHQSADDRLLLRGRFRPPIGTEMHNFLLPRFRRFGTSTAAGEEEVEDEEEEVEDEEEEVEDEEEEAF